MTTRGTGRGSARNPAGERVFVVAYDIADPRRWRRVFRIMNGYGRWLQLSVFQCRLTPRRRAELAAALEAVIKREEDHVVLVDIGPAETVSLAVESLGRRFEPILREALVI
jgi:CRISPR-associated protein Cas2